MRQVIARLGVDRSLILLAGFLSFLLLLLSLVGWIWVVRLPPAPTVLPDPLALAPASVIFPESDEADFLQSLATVPNGATGDETAQGDETAEGDATEGLLEAGALLNPNAAAQAAAPADITSRPLFWPGRRPVVESDEPEEVATGRPRRDEFDKVKLVGVYFAGPASGIIIELDGERQRLRLEEELFGWTLEMLSANSAVFSKGEDKQKTLQLEHADTAKYTATAKPAMKKAGSAETEEVGQ